MNRLASLLTAAITTGLSAAAVGATAVSQGLFDVGVSSQSAEPVAASAPAGTAAFPASAPAWSAQSNAGTVASEVSRKDDDHREHDDSDHRERADREHDDDD